MKIVVTNTISTIEGVEGVKNGDLILIEIDNALAVRPKGYMFTPAFKNRIWDGYERFFNKKTGTFPTGLLWKVLEVLEDFDYEFEDNRYPYTIEIPEEITLLEPNAEGGIITLRDYQYDAVKNAITQTRGVVNVATNGGKTEIASGIIKQLLPKIRAGQTILFITHNLEIFNQSAKRIEKRLNIKVGKVGGGTWDIRPVTVIMVPTVSKYIKEPTKKDIKYTGEMKAVKLIVDLIGKEDDLERGDLIKVIQMFESTNEKAEQTAAEILGTFIGKKFNKEIKKLKSGLEKFERKAQKKDWDKYDQVQSLLKSAICFIGDEFHHSSSSTWYDTIQKMENAVYRIGLTGTVDEKDPVNVMRVFGCTGNILSKISNDFLIKNGFSAKPTIYLEDIHEKEVTHDSKWQQAYKEGIVDNAYRNQRIAEAVKEKYDEGKGCLIITTYIEHVEDLLKRLTDIGVKADYTHGKRKDDDRERVLEQMRTGELKVVIATSVLDEGVDISGINGIWLAAGGKSFRQTLQRIGRGLRVKEDGSGVDVFDYVDYTHEILLKHSLERLKYYKGEKFKVKKVK